MHARLAAAAGRPAIWDLVADIKIHMDRVRKLTLKPDHAPRLIAQHRAIVDAVAARDARGAAAAMADHLAFVIEHFDEFVSDEAAYSS